jgi:hypothetical protein
MSNKKNNNIKNNIIQLYKTEYREIPKHIYILNKPISKPNNTKKNNTKPNNTKKNNTKPNNTNENNENRNRAGFMSNQLRKYNTIGRNFSLTPNRANDTTEVILDSDTIMLYMNCHGEISKNNCIDISKYIEIDFFQKVYIGQLGCVNIDSFKFPYRLNKLFDFFKSLNHGIKLNLLHICREIYKTFRPTVSDRSSAMKRFISENIHRGIRNPKLYGHDHHSSFVYDSRQAQNNGSIIFDKSYSIDQSDINKQKNYASKKKDIFLIQKQNIEKLKNFQKTKKSIKMTQNNKEYIQKLENYEKKLHYINISISLPGIVILFDGKNPILDSYRYLYNPEQPFLVHLSDILQQLIYRGYKKILIYDISCNAFDDLSVNFSNSCLPENSNHF